MGQFPQQPLHYMAQPPAPTVRFGRGLFGWVLFIGLAVMLYFLLDRQNKAYKPIPLSEFMARLDEKQISRMTLEENQIRGQFFQGQAMADGTTVRDFRTQLPAGMGADWAFVQFLLEKSGDTASVEVRTGNNYVVNILLPLIPWLLIFLFIWFFVFRQLRKASAAQAAQAAATGPGRWVPDQPGKAGQA